MGLIEPVCIFCKLLDEIMKVAWLLIGKRNHSFAPPLLITKLNIKRILRVRCVFLNFPCVKIDSRIWESLSYPLLFAELAAGQEIMKN